jgi:hypothetical protein
MRVYSADSVKMALEEMERYGKRACKGLDTLHCPATDLVLDKEYGGNGRKCNDAPPDKCRYAQKRGCRRIIFIYNDKAKTRLYCMLPLYFTISDKSRKGFIDSEDNQLGALIRKGDISVDHLEALEI